MKTDSNTPSWKLMLVVAVLASILGGLIGASGIFLLREGTGKTLPDDPPGITLPKVTPAPRRTPESAPSTKQKTSDNKTGSGKQTPGIDVIVAEIVKIENAFTNLYFKHTETRQWAIQSLQILKQQQAAYSSLQKQFWGALTGVVSLLLGGGVAAIILVRKFVEKKFEEQTEFVKQLGKQDTSARQLQEEVNSIKHDMATVNDILQQSQTRSQQALKVASTASKALTNTVKDIHGSLEELHKESEEGDKRLHKIIKQLQRSLKNFTADTQKSYLNLEEVEFEVVEEEE